MNPDFAHLHPIGPTVIVAEDDSELLAVVMEALRADGYRVVAAHDGEELLALVADTLGNPSARADLIITDVRMPGLSGLGVLLQLRRLGIRLPTLMMTGFSPESVETVAKSLGAAGVLRKPFDLDALRAAVSAARGGEPVLRGGLSAIPT
jgi:DNA-binding response OmpR family regulator